jgi:hypothetical protein
VIVVYPTPVGSIFSVRFAPVPTIVTFADGTTPVLLLLALTVNDPAADSASLTVNTSPSVRAGSVGSDITPDTTAGPTTGSDTNGVVATPSPTITGGVFVPPLDTTVVTPAGELLFPSFDSATVPDGSTTAPPAGSVYVPAVAVLTRTVSVTVPPAPTVPDENVTARVPASYTLVKPPLTVVDSKSRPSGRVTVAPTPVADTDPPLPTVNV